MDEADHLLGRLQRDVASSVIRKNCYQLLGSLIPSHLSGACIRDVLGITTQFLRYTPRVPRSTAAFCMIRLDWMKRACTELSIWCVSVKKNLGHAAMYSWNQDGWFGVSDFVSQID